MNLRATVFLIAAVGSIPSTWAGPRNDPSGFVATVSGGWQDCRTKKTLQPNDPLYPGDRICGPRDQSSASMRIVLFDADKATQQLCSPPKDKCPSSYTVRDSEEPVGWGKRLVDMITSMTQLDVENQRTAASRGGKGPEDGIVESGEGVDLAALLRPVGLGEYRYELLCWRGDAGCDGHAVATTGILYWDVTRLRLDRPLRMAPGLYRIRLYDGAGRPKGDSAVVLAVPSEKVEHARTLVDRWLDRVRGHSGLGRDEMRPLHIRLLVALHRDPSKLEDKR
jgi:hypothetical protein